MRLHPTHTIPLHPLSIQNPQLSFPHDPLFFCFHLYPYIFFSFTVFREPHPLPSCRVSILCRVLFLWWSTVVDSWVSPTDRAETRKKHQWVKERKDHGSRCQQCGSWTGIQPGSVKTESQPSIHRHSSKFEWPAVHRSRDPTSKVCWSIVTFKFLIKYLIVTVFFIIVY